MKKTKNICSCFKLRFKAEIVSDKRRSMGSDQEKRLAQGKKCTATDTKYFQAAENLLYVELGVALGKPKQEICKTIIDYINQSRSGA